MLHVKTWLAPSAISGIGLFANEYIAKGTVIWTFHVGFDIRIPTDEIVKIPQAAQDKFWKYAYLNGETKKYVYCSDDARFFNHSDDLNTCDAETPDGDEDGATIAVRDILPGEEITCDYGTFHEGFVGIENNFFAHFLQTPQCGVCMLSRLPLLIFFHGGF